MWLLWFAGVLTMLKRCDKTLAIISFVVVLPLAPLMAMTRLVGGIRRR